MANEPTHSPPADDASWESLAENLFGIDLKHPGLSEDLAAEDLSLEDELLDPAQVEARDQTGEARAGIPAAPVPPSPQPPASSAPERADRAPERADRAPRAAAAADDLEFGADLGLDDELAFDEPAIPQESDEEDVRLIESRVAAREPERAWEPAGDDDSDEPFAADLDLPEDTLSDEMLAEDDEAEEPAEPEASDTYWDALKEWEWDDTDEPPAPAESGGRRPGGRGGRGARGGRTQSYVPRAAVEPEQPAWAEGRDEFIEDPEFGTGLLDDGGREQPAAEPARRGDVAAERASERRPERRPEGRRDREGGPPPEEGEGPRRGRRRRRGRGRGEPEETGAATHERASEDMEDVGMLDDTDVGEVEDRAAFDEPDFAGEGDEFGLGLDADVESPREASERAPRRGRRRRSRRRDREDSGAAAAAPRGRSAERREAAPETAWGTESEELDEPEDEPENELEEASEAASWEDVPTWEDAVGLLLGPGRSSSRESSGRGSSGGGRDDSGERSRTRGRSSRRPRRRR